MIQFGGMQMMGPMMMGGMNPMMMQMMMFMQMMQMMQMAQMMLGQQGQQGQGAYPGMPQMGMPDCGCQMPGMPWGGRTPFPPYFPPGLSYPTGPVGYNPQSGNALADTAASWAGQPFKPGESRRCADYVSTMIEQSGQAPPGFRHQMSCDQLQRYGVPVDRENLKPGDVVFFGNTYRPGQYTHTGIYLGNGRFSHRPTAGGPVRVDNINSRYYASHFSGGRRLNAQQV